ncbi:26S proteasome AAA-ATPase subunit (nucleomorph) [Cryptomonas paramecium]|uniref:26S proteasome AAA-ATPase subunit n=1 Tax=Cryptomonas paramaecium TaxID=2898 RepID=F2HHH6_9CRYP|nr:26S proteasome AAA-ATPase subunit [Cryptomonas paramecium]AEA38772.1 26S proteasome AAA-ATPase subunit [Cryptomonas paramecium]
MNNLNTNKIYVEKYEVLLKKLKLSREKNKQIHKKLEKIKLYKKRLNKKLIFFQQMGSLVGEVIENISDNYYIIKAPAGTKYVVGVQNNVKKIKLTSTTRIALDPSTLTIIKILEKKVEKTINDMLKENPGKINYEDIGGLSKPLQQLKEIVEIPMFNPEIFLKIGIKVPKGILLYGPPGTGKTLLARGMASNLKCLFLKIVASSIIDKYIGESARIIREIFLFSKTNSPSIIFIDEIDAIGGKRLSEGSSADREIQRTLIELLNQMDGFEDLIKVKVIMATNRPDVLDPALLRPGRLDRKLLIPLPDFRGKYEIIKIYLKKIKWKNKIEIKKIITKCENFNGADLRNVCTEAGLFAIRNERTYVTEQDLIKAVRKIQLSKKNR